MKEFKNADELIDFIYVTIKSQGQTVASVEKNCGFSIGSIGKWKSNYPSVGRVINVLKYLGYTISISSSEEKGRLPNILEVKEETTDDSSIDLEIFEAILRILKSESIELDKKKLLSILQLL